MNRGWTTSVFEPDSKVANVRVCVCQQIELGFVVPTLHLSGIHSSVNDETQLCKSAVVVQSYTSCQVSRRTQLCKSAAVVQSYTSCQVSRSALVIVNKLPPWRQSAGWQCAPASEPQSRRCSHQGDQAGIQLDCCSVIDRDCESR
jgi:hypothetical protein